MSGHIEKRVSKNGAVKWKIIVNISVDPITGRRIRHYETMNGTKAQAEKRLRTILNELETNSFIGKNDFTVGDWIEEWLNVYVGKTHSPNTLRRYRQIAEAYIKPKVGTVRLQGLTTMMLQRFYNEIKDVSPVSGSPISNKTLRNIHMVMQAALGKACKLGLIPKNPARDVDLPKPQRYTAEVYDQGEIRQLLEYAINTDLFVSVNILLCLGLRRAELIALKYSDIGWEQSKITISRTLAMSNGKLIEKAPKTQSSNRTIDMPIQLFRSLYGLRAKEIGSRAVIP
ncbi:MAG: hypothetical protein FWE91_12365 [Defluviitaleaceae bacterium]|nr:hypothetical protein [Defluviitaleaceae bacterium]MCL2836642.1 hypothetical protein [Defluviitaleaceae bacterium]